MVVPPLLQPPSSARLRHAPGLARLTCLRFLDLRERDAQSLNRNGFDCGSTGPAPFFTCARLGLALATVRFVTFPRTALDSLRVLGRAVVPFLFWTFDDCFLRLAMIDPSRFGASQGIDAEYQETARLSSRQPIL